MAIRLQAEGKKSLHKDLKQKRREQREQRERKKAAKEEEMQRLKQLQEEKERKLQELELLKEAQQQAELLLQEEEQRRKQQHEEMQRTLEIQLQEAEQVCARWADAGGFQDLFPELTEDSRCINERESHRCFIWGSCHHVDSLLVQQPLWLIQARPSG